ncbi:MAG: PEP-CTERM system histidine kinase PrsK [Sphingomonadales bacterium]|jgi:putative PEP-CTERM system histidine kinase|nr:PEP-CTERM system histidine kinase PrsK [Sphingomonadales bacterium]MBK9003425.1 PEP-CTERM system histidine kinase PrsK [Sphingomonadales bacterium]MBK9268593.1 PEP-CTERM system histidine kinase PrsK [Sphingomonadales bacterium]
MASALVWIGFWGHAAVGFLYAALAIWVFHQFGGKSRQQIALIAALSVTAFWGIVTIMGGPGSLLASSGETLRNMGWLGFLYALLSNGEGNAHPRTIKMLYGALFLALLLQPAIDFALLVALPDSVQASAAAAKTVQLLRMIFAIGAIVLVHNLYTVSAPEARWGISLPMAALAATWMYDLNLYTIGYLSGNWPAEFIAMRGLIMMMLVPVFAMATRRNSNWRIRLSRSVTFQSVSLLAIGAYLFGMMLLATGLQLVGGSYARMAQITLIFAMSLAAMLIMPSGKFRAWLNVVIAKNFFQHRYDYRAEWMRFAETIGFPNDSAPFHERVIKSLADIFESPAGLLLTRDNESRLVLQARWNWPTADIPTYAGNSQTVPFFERTGHILLMDEVREGTDERVEQSAIPQWLYDEPRAWAVIPLVHFGRLAGIAVLAKPPIKRSLDWEDLDMMRVVGRQLASYLAEATSQEELTESRQFEQFNRRFAFVMHDIKNLVSQLSLLARNAEKHASNPDFQADMIETLKSSVGKMNDLLARLSQHSQTRHSAIEPMDVESTVSAVIHGKRLIYPIETDFSPGLLAMADAGRVETILNHLVQNAIDATEDGAPIRVSASRQDDWVAIRVTDKGSGMTEAFVADQLFKPFESTKSGGFGIGAYEARALAQSLGGHLHVDSRVGKGTRMTLLLPAAKEADQDKSIEKVA